MYNEPFFSIYLIATKREKTIINTLESLCNQTFNNFEVIVTTRNYNDKTRDNIEKFKKTSLFKKNETKFKIYNIDKAYHSIEEWNDPLEYGRGKYCGILEGDDKFEPRHLELAYQEINAHDNIGIYATGNQIGSLKNIGFLLADEYHNYVLSMLEISPPSQTFFIRKDNYENIFFYNTKDYVYAPEIELYLRLSSQSFNAFQSKHDTVTRDIKKSKGNSLSWKYYHDQNRIMSQKIMSYSVGGLIKSDLFFKKKMLKAVIKGILSKQKFDFKLLLESLNFLNIVKRILKKINIRINKYLVKTTILLNHKKEVNISLVDMMKYFLFTEPKMFPNKIYTNFKGKISIKEVNNFYIANFDDMNIYYPKTWEQKTIIANMNAILNEQSYLENNTSPHQYKDLGFFNKEDIIYDVGAAEGLQSKLWVKHAKRIVIFEPDPLVVQCLNKTFEEELSLNQITIVPEGISQAKFDTDIKGRKYYFDTIISLIDRYNLPYPTYLKADIEGHEKSLIEALNDKSILESLNMIQIMTYHRPEDSNEIPKLLNNFKGKGYFSKGLIWFNRDFSTEQQELFNCGYKNIAFPTFRKCMYTWDFNA